MTITFTKLAIQFKCADFHLFLLVSYSSLERLWGYHRGKVPLCILYGPPIYWLWSYWYCLSHPIGRITDVDGDHIWKWTLTFKPFSRISSALAPRTVQCTAIFSLRRMPNERTVYRAKRERESNNKVSIMHNPSDFHCKAFHDLLSNKFIIWSYVYCPDIVRCKVTNLTWLNNNFIFFLLFFLFFSISIWEYKRLGQQILWIWVWYKNCTFFGTFWQYIRRVRSCHEYFDATMFAKYEPWLDHTCLVCH